MDTSLMIADDNMFTTLVTPTIPTHDSFADSKTDTHTVEKRKNEIKVCVSSLENRVMIDGFIESYHEALQLSKNSMIPVFSSIPSGKESGIFLAIDLGGSTLRVAVMEVQNKKTTPISEMSWLINDNQKVMDENFFKLIAYRIKTVIESQSVLSCDQTIHCGITWSFPLRQTMPNNGLIENVSKGYELTSYSKEKDLKMLVEKSCKEIGLDISVDAIINDAISVVVAGKYLHNSEIGLVLGTGTNCSISIPQQLLSSNKRLKNPVTHCLLNTELSYFGNHLQKYSNKFDQMIDNRWNMDFTKFPKPHMTTELYGVFQPLELMTSGRYITELIRLRLVDSSTNGPLSISNYSLPSAYDLDSQCVCDINENSNFEIFESLYDVKTTEKDRHIISDIIKSVIERAVYVLGFALIGLMELLAEVSPQSEDDDDDDLVKIGYVGSIMQYFHKYREELETFINSEQDRKVKFVNIENSSVIGAAISAAVNNGK